MSQFANTTVESRVSAIESELRQKAGSNEIYSLRNEICTLQKNITLIANSLIQLGEITEKSLLNEKAPQPPKKCEKAEYIKLSAYEIQSGYDRVRWAEDLILQLSENHDGRNSWLLNYSTGRIKTSS